MKLERIVNFGPGRVGLMFRHEDLCVDKILRSEHMAIGKHDKPAFLRSQFLHLAREADRDGACMLFGDEWQKHAPRGAWQDYEQRRLELAAKLRPDLFGDAE